MYLIVVHFHGYLKEAVDKADNYIDALSLQRKYSMAFKEAVEIVKV